MAKKSHHSAEFVRDLILQLPPAERAKLLNVKFLIQLIHGSGPATRKQLFGCLAHHPDNWPLIRVFETFDQLSIQIEDTAVEHMQRSLQEKDEYHHNSMQKQVAITRQIKEERDHSKESQGRGRLQRQQNSAKLRAGVTQCLAQFPKASLPSFAS